MYTSRRELGLQRHVSHGKPSHSISQRKKCLTGCTVTSTRKLHSASRGDMNMCLKYWEQHLGRAVNVIKARCLFIYFYVCPFLYDSRGHIKEASNLCCKSKPEYIPVFKSVSPHPSLFKVTNQQWQEQRDTVEIKYILMIALPLQFNSILDY